MSEKEYALLFSLFPGIGTARLNDLIRRFRTLEKAWNAKEKDFRELGMPSFYKRFDEFRTTFNLEKYLTQLKKYEVSYVSIVDKDYPKGLKKLSNPPMVLYFRGNKKLFNKPSIGVVGTRKVTTYGKEVTEYLVGGLVEAGMIIVSGLALGVDSIAHRKALESKGGTIAVLGSGINMITPRENERLGKEILDKKGLIVSEYRPNLPSNAGTFPARNRIIAALSNGVLITEAAKDSGSLITAKEALKLGKKVFAIPGPINSQMSKGGFELIKNGGILVQDAGDILREFSVISSQFTNKKKISKLNLSKDEKEIVSLLENEKMTMDEIFKKTKIPISKLFAIISEMELRGIVKQTNGKLEIIVWD